ncbi:MAG: alpha/beta fold hydrolase [Halomonadaceae bacterium]|nr:MAG: alpha/beta fold hydrolase [Halomonadaceae bacterium]
MRQDNATHSTSAMQATRDETLAALERVGSQYLAKTANTDHAEAAARWQPRISLWSRLQRASRWLPGVTLHQQPIADHLIHYWQVGPDGGTPVVLVHGFGASKENWLSLLPLLSRRGFTLYVPDLPGFGQSSYRHSQRYSYDVQARRMAEWADNLKLAPAHWVGSSMGGAICAHLAARHSPCVRSVTLMNAAGLGAETPSTTDRVLMEGGNMLIPASLADTRRLFRVTTHRASALISLLMAPAMYRDMHHRSPVSRHIFYDMLHPEETVPDLLPSITAPVKILWGDKDQVLHVSCAYRFSQLLPDAKLTVLPNIGHLPMLEAPLKTASLLRQFWQTPG